jgi:hypothetical protein
MRTQLDLKGSGARRLDLRGHGVFSAMVHIASCMLRRTLNNLAAVSLFTLTLAHELDAVAQHEWRILPVLSSLAEASARQAFVLLHVPLIFGLLWGLFVAREAVQQHSRFALGLFMVGHVLLHATLEVPGLSSFEEAPSRAFIVIAGLAGVLVVMTRARPHPATHFAESTARSSQL